MMKGKLQNWLYFSFKREKLFIYLANETIYIKCYIL